jgi:feruloyl-CoA synthase
MAPADDRGAAATAPPPFKPLAQKLPDVRMERKPDGTVYLRSNHEPGPGPSSIPHLLAERAAAHPDRPYLLKRDGAGGPWKGATYGEAKRAADGIAQWLLDLGLTAADTVMVLSANSVEQGLLVLGCYTAGVPVAPISPAYSLISTDHAKLKYCFETLRPKVVFAQESPPFQRAFETLKAIDPDLIFVTLDGGDGSRRYSDIVATEPTAAVEASRARINHDTVAKYLFTSGSTGVPKAVIQVHRMFFGSISAVEGLRTVPADPDFVPKTLEWMPWSHISAGNMIFHLVMWNGGSYYIDDGRPTPGQFETTIRNLGELSPIQFGSAPVAMGMLADAMERDPELRHAVFKNLRSLGYGGSTMSNDIGDRLQACAIAETGFRIPITTTYGATETQGITSVHWATERMGMIGAPLPGMTIKLVPNGTKLEVRAKGPTVTPGYYNDPEKTAAAFDEEGFYTLGDACRFMNPDDPSEGLIFDGRVTEDFKLNSSTWVSVGTLRTDLLTACSPLVRDIVIAGQDKAFVGALIWPSEAVLAELGDGALDKVAVLIRARLAEFNRTAGGSSRRIGRFVVLAEPPSIDAGEITDKGYVNQRATLEHRAGLVDAIYRETPGSGVVQV